MNTANRMRMMWVLVITVVALLAGGAEAQKQWNNAGDGTWNVGPWTPIGVPASSDDVKIGAADDATIETVTIAAGDPAAVAANLYVGTRDSSPLVTGSEGGLIINANSAGDTRLTISGEFGVGSARAGQANARLGTVTHNNGVANATGILNIGEYPGGTLSSYTLNSGTLNVGGVLWGNAVLTTTTGSAGTITQGANTTVTVTGNYLSDQFSSTLTRTHTVGSGATLSISGYGEIRGAFKLDNNGGNISVGSYLLVGSGASRPMTAAVSKNWSMNGGTFTVGGLFTMGSSSGSPLEMMLSGGTLQVDDLLLGFSTSKLTISGSGLLLANNANYTVAEANQDITDGQIVASGMTPDTVIVGGTTYTRIAALPTVNITANDAAATEAGQTTGQFTVSRGARTDGALVVNYTLPDAGGRATPGSGAGGDYTTTPAATYGSRTGSVTIPDTATSATITVTPVDDATSESSEDVVLTLATDAAYAVGASSSATVTIADDDAGNVAPSVNAGTDQTVVVNTLPTGNVTLDATLVADDGTPVAATFLWTKQSGPGTVTFTGGDTALDTTATFDTAGTYVLLLTADDTALQGSDTVTIIVQDNEAPVVDAGSNQSAAFAAGAVSLSGTLTLDDGLPVGPTYTWSKDSGPGTVTFGNENALSTTASFSEAGTYVLRLTADDTLATSFDTVTITLRAPVTFTAQASGRFNEAGTWDAPGGVAGPPIYGDTANIGSNYIVTNLIANGITNLVTVNIQNTGKLQLVDPGAVAISPIHSSATVNVASGGTLEIQSENNVVGTINLNGGRLSYSAGTGNLAAGATLNINNDSLLTPISSAIPKINCPVHGTGKLTLTADAANSSASIQFDAASDWSGAWDFQGNLRFSSAFQQRWIPGDERVASSKTVEFLSTTARTIKGTRSGSGTDTLSTGVMSTNVLGDGSGNGVLSPGDGTGGVGAVTMSAIAANMSHTFLFNTNSTYTVDITGTAGSAYDKLTVAGNGTGTGNVQVVSGAKLVINLWKPTTDTVLDAMIIDGSGEKIGSDDFTGNITWNNAVGWSGLTASWTGPDLHVTGTYTAPVVTMTAMDNAATEAPVETGTFTVARGARTDGALVVNYRITGTATPGGDPNDYTLGFSGSGSVDYTASTGTVTIADGDTSATITVTPFDDATIENTPETVILSLTNGVYTFGTPSNDTVTITSDDAGNLAPEVNAGIDQTVVVNTLPTGTVTLDATLVADDGVPVAATFLWTKQSGPGTVTFTGGDTALDTTATFDTAGTYVLLLTADDTELQGSDTVTIIVQDNEAPVVDAGSDQSTAFAAGAVATLSGTLTPDDGLPTAPTYTWSKDSGPGTVTFGDDNALSTTANFSEAGTYVLRLTADDTLATGFDTVTITLRAPVTFTAQASGRFNAAGTWDAPGGVAGPPIYGDTANIGGNYIVTNLIANGITNLVTVNIQNTGKLQLVDPGDVAISPIHSGATVNVATGGTLEIQSENNVVGTINLNGGTLSHNSATGGQGNLAAGATLNINSDSFLAPIGAALTRINCPAHGAGKLTLATDASTVSAVTLFAAGSTWSGAWDFQGNIRFSGFEQRWIPGNERVAVGKMVNVTVITARTIKGTRSGFGMDAIAATGTNTLGEGTGNGVLSPGDGAGGVGTVTMAASGTGNDNHTFVFNAGSTYTVDITGTASSAYDKLAVAGTGTGTGNVKVVNGAKLVLNLWKPTTDTVLDATIIDGSGAKIGSDDFTGNITWNNTTGWSGLTASWTGPDLHVTGTYTAPVVTLTATDNAAAEAPSDAGTFTVSRDARTDGDLVVHYRLTGTATPGGDPNDYTLGFSGSGSVDYTAKTGTVTIADGAASATITVTPFDDAVVENIPETVILTLTNGVYTLGTPSNDTVTITSEDFANLAPEVSAGQNLTNAVSALPAANVALSGFATDDGFMGPMSYQWSKVSGPGTVTFSGGAAVTNTTADFSAAGDYVLELVADDGGVSGTGTVSVTIIVNTAPVVDAGPDQSQLLAAGAVTLAGTLTTDDGLPIEPTYTWSKDSGPGTVTFGDDNALSTTASFSEAGTYVLRLTADDTLATGFDTVTITLRAPITYTAVAGGHFNAAGTWDAPGGVVGPPLVGDTANIGGSYTVTTLSGNEVASLVTVNIQSTGKLQLVDPGASAISPIHSGATVNVASGATLEIQSENNVVGTINLNGGTLSHNTATGGTGNLAAGATLNINSDSFLTPIGTTLIRINCPVHGAGTLTLTADANTSTTSMGIDGASTWSGAWNFQGNIRFNTFYQRYIPGDARVASGKTVSFLSTPNRTIKGTRYGFGTDTVSTGTASASTNTLGDGSGNGVLSPGDGTGVGAITMSALGTDATHLFVFNTNSTYNVNINGTSGGTYDTLTVAGTGAGVGNVKVQTGAKLMVNLWAPSVDTVLDATIIDGSGAKLGSDNFVVTWINTSYWTDLAVTWIGPDLHVTGTYYMPEGAVYTIR